MFYSKMTISFHVFAEDNAAKPHVSQPGTPATQTEPATKTAPSTESKPGLPMTESELRPAQSEPRPAQSEPRPAQSETRPTAMSESEEEEEEESDPEEFESRPTEPPLAQSGLPFAQPSPTSAQIRSLAPHLRPLYTDQEPPPPPPTQSGQFVPRPGPAVPTLAPVPAPVPAPATAPFRPPSATLSRPPPAEPGPSQVTLASVTLKGKQATKRGPSAIQLGPPVEQSEDGTIGFEKTFMVSSDGKYRWAVYICKVCLKNCDSISAIKKHLVVHTGEKPFSCRICGRKFTQKSTLKTHLKTLHGTDVM